MNPYQLANSGTEHGEQRALFAWVRMAIKHGWRAANDMLCYEKGGMAYAMEKYGEQDALTVLEEYYAIPNGGLRDKITAAKLKAEGVIPGTPDTHLPVACGQFHSLYIEMKTETGRESEQQKERFPRLRAQGNEVKVCHSWQDAVTELMNYLSLGAFSA